MYDFIGDVHGQAERLEALLQKIGYSKKSGIYSHPSRKVIFIGDLVDRGPEQIRTIEIAKNMVDKGSAKIVMGNHEYNAVTWATEDPEKPGKYLREHDSRNRVQHQAFLEQVGEGSKLHLEIISWFKSLPIFIETHEFRAIHACWHGPFVELAKSFLDSNNAILKQAWPLLSRHDTEPYLIIETLLKGTEIELPAGCSYFDPDGNERIKTRTRWWDEKATTYRSAGILKESLKPQLPENQIPSKSLLTYDQKSVLFIGHYWMSGMPSPLTPKIACLDYSIGKGSKGTKLCAYRWNGEQRLSVDGFVWVDALPEQS